MRTALQFLTINMKVLTLLLALSVSAAAADNIPSPDGAYVLEIGKSARIVDHSHATVLTVVPNVQGAREVAAQWSADSRRVVLVLNYDRGAGVYAAYLEGGSWKRTIEQDSDFPSADLARQAGVSGFVASDKRMIVGWAAPDRVNMKGEATYKGGHHVGYAYTLVFTGGPTNLSRGGYEDGAIKGIDFHVR
jgi:hypothetical protein